jgi:rhodanese-related sulfurtransferase
MKRTFLAVFFAVLAFASPAQYKNDNVAFKTIFPQDLCKDLEKNKEFLLLDVRSAGEYNDTSSSTGLNLGHLRGAVNIDIRQVGKRLNELASYKNKPVFVYCSHSQRSRRVSKMLSDSGFINVNNINGGMTAFYLLTGPQRACLQSMITTANHYAVISPADLCKKLSSEEQVYLLDVRPDSAWSHISSNPKWNAYGYLQGARHLSLDMLATTAGELPHDQEIIITDLFGGDAAVAAGMLAEKGYDRVSVLLEGMDRWLSTDRSGYSCKGAEYVPAVSYSIMNSAEFSRYLPVTKGLLLLDVRSEEEFANKHQQGYRNIGHLKNAQHIPASGLKDRLGEIEKHRSGPVLLCDFSGGMDVYDAANTLAQNGFKKIIVLSGGLFNVRWTASNVPGMYFMHDWVVDVPEENK